MTVMVAVSTSKLPYAADGNCRSAKTQHGVQHAKRLSAAIASSSMCWPGRHSAVALCIALLSVGQAFAQDIVNGVDVDSAVAAWRAGGADTPVTFSEWQGKFHDGSGAFGTYINNQDSWYLIDPCGDATTRGEPCHVLLWFEVFDTEEIYDTLKVYDGYTDMDQIVTLDGGDDKVVLSDTLIRSEGSALLLHFVSDAYRSFQGFTAVYKTDTDTSLSLLDCAELLSPAFVYSATGPYIFRADVLHEQLNTTIRAINHDEHPYNPWFASVPTGFQIADVEMFLNGEVYDPNTTMTVDLVSGVLNDFDFRVIASDQLTEQVYTVRVNRPADTEAHLIDCTFSTGDTEPLFDPNIFMYNTTVIFEIGHVTVTPVPLDPDLKEIRVGIRGSDCMVNIENTDCVAPSGYPSNPVMLLNGDFNIVDVVVMAEDGTTFIVYTNIIFRPQFSRSQFERQFFNGEWRRTQHGDYMLMTLGGHWDPCNNTAWTTPNLMGDVPTANPSECRENSWELQLRDYSGRTHAMRGWFEVNTFAYPVQLTLDVVEATGQYEELGGARLQGWYRFTDWPVPSTDSLITNSRTHVNIEVDLAVCLNHSAVNASVQPDISVKADNLVGAELLIAPESQGPGGMTAWSCPTFSPYLGNDTSRYYIQMLKDVDECEDQTHSCSVDAVCTNTYGSRWCACKSGYEGNPYFDACTDIDECNRGTHNCGLHTHCINTLGAFNCSCDTGHEGNPSVYTFDVDVTPDGSIDVLKAPGSEWECVSVHENHTCQRVPTIYPQRMGSLRGRWEGAVLDPSRGDDQEQLWNFDRPPNPAYRYDSQHYYREKTDPAYVRALTESVPFPPPRWHFDGIPAADNECADVDECATEAHGCSDNGYCFNVPGSFSCHCHIGYRGDAYGLDGCTDIDECAEETSDCSTNSICINVPGAHLCECPDTINHDGQLFWNGRVPGKPYNSRCHMPLRQSRTFVTFERWTGEQINTLQGADAKCQSEGPELQPGFRWKAILSDVGIDAVHHLTDGDTNILYPVIRTDGALVAVDEDQLWSGMALRDNTVRLQKEYSGLSNPINVDGSGEAVDPGDEWTGGHEVWTGSDVNGARMPYGNCFSWREQTSFAQNQVGGAGPTADGPTGSSNFAGESALASLGLASRPAMYAGDLWQFDGPALSTGSYSKPATHLPGGSGGSYGDLRSTFSQWHAARDTLRECETKRRRLFCMEVHYSTESVLRDPSISPYGGHMNSTWMTASASTVLRPNEIYPSHAIDGINTTFWQASLRDTAPWFQVDMRAHFTVTAVMVKWHDSCFPSAYAIMLSNDPSDYPPAPTSMYAGWRDPSWQRGTTAEATDSSWRIFHEIISRTWRGGDDRLANPTLAGRQENNRTLVKNPAASVTAVSPPEVARHMRVAVTDQNDLWCHGITDIIMFSPEERPYGSYTEGPRRAQFRKLQQVEGGPFPRSSHGSRADSSVDGDQSYNTMDAWPTPTDGAAAYTAGTDRHQLEAQAGFPQVTTHGPPGWEFLQLRARHRATDRQHHTRFDNMRHRYTQADSKLNPGVPDHPQFPCPPGVASCDETQPSSQEGHDRAATPTPNTPTFINYANQKMTGRNETARQEDGKQDSTSTRYRETGKVVDGGPSEGYRARGSPDGDPMFSNESPLRQHNNYRGTVREYDVRADTAAYPQPMHDSQRKASAPDLEGPQWKPGGPQG